MSEIYRWLWWSGVEVVNVIAYIIFYKRVVRRLEQNVLWSYLLRRPYYLCPYSPEIIECTILHGTHTTESCYAIFHFHKEPVPTLARLCTPKKQYHNLVPEWLLQSIYLNLIRRSATASLTIPKEFIRNLILSLSRLMQAVIRARDSDTHDELNIRIADQWYHDWNVAHQFHFLVVYFELPRNKRIVRCSKCASRSPSSSYASSMV